MKLDIFQKIGFTICIGILLYILTDTLLAKPINNENVTLIEGHFKNIEQFRPKGKFSTSYNFYIQENQESYKILPEWIGCFNYESFRNEIRQGQRIKIYIRNNNGLRSSKLPVVVSLIANNKDYLNQGCINNEIENNKITMPLTIVGLLLLAGSIFYLDSRYLRNKKRN